MHRFYWPDALGEPGTALPLAGPLAHRIGRVLRLQAGEAIALFDGSGHEWHLTLTSVRPAQVTAVVTGRRAPAVEPRLQVTLYQAPLKGDATEAVLRQCTEVGVSRFVLVITERTVARRVDEGKLTRWRRVVQEAAEQSGRCRLPVVETAVALADLPAHRGGLPTWVLWEGERHQGLGAAAATGELAALALVVGPEGGLSSAEVALLAAGGCQVASLGPRVLRAATAGVVAASVVLHRQHDLG